MKKIILFFQCFFYWKDEYLTNKEKQKSVDAYFCQSFGRRKHDSGTSNKFLGYLVKRAYETKAKPLIIQADIVESLNGLKVDRLIYRHQISRKHLDTFEVSKQCVKYCKKYDYKTVLVFTHQKQVWRVRKTLKKLGLNTIIANVAGVPYDSESVQIWTRNKWVFIPREILARLYYLFTNKI